MTDKLRQKQHFLSFRMFEKEVILWKRQSWVRKKADTRFMHRISVVRSFPSYLEVLAHHLPIC
nr:MAG TPA: hypothetical protein [Caudoviricetes sp.]